MAKAELKSFGKADEVRQFPKGRLELVRFGGATIGRAVFEPGWRWATSVQSLVKTKSCEAPHFQYHVSGILRIRMDDGTEFSARIAVPGFDAKDIQVSAMPVALVIQAETAHTHEGKSGDVCFCEFSGKQLFRRLDLPASVDVDKVSASVDNGILQITAPKAATKPMAAGA